KQVICYYCNKPGHVVKDCRQLKALKHRHSTLKLAAPANRSPIKSEYVTGRRTPLICYYCNKPGHVVKDCRQLKALKQSSNSGYKGGYSNSGNGAFTSVGGSTFGASTSGYGSRGPANNSSGHSRKQVICYYCNKPGHVVKDCRQLKA
ncbi:hypothetical protein VOLCADRAFT_30373, partial [Volvox carteri f. nagariensis]